MKKDLRLSIIFDALDHLSAPLRGIGEETKRSAKKMAGMRKELKQLERTQKTVARFKELKRETQETGRRMEQAGNRATELGRQIAQAEKPSRQLRAEFTRTRRESKRLEQQFEKQHAALNETRHELRQAGVQTSRLSQHERELGRSIAAANDQIDRQGQKMKSLYAAKARGEKLRARGAGLRSAGAGASIAITAPVVALGAAASAAATDFVELESAFEVTFGQNTKRMRAWTEEQGKLLERSRAEMMAMSMSFQDVLKKQLPEGRAVEMSQRLTLLTQDLASFKNLSNEVSQQKIFSGLIGESEPLRRVGVILNETMVAAKATAMGLDKVNGKFTEGAKIEARAALIMEQLSDAHGDILRTQESTANRIKAASAAWDDLKVTLGTRLLPALTPVINGIANLLEAFGSLPPGFQQFLIWAAAIAAIVGPALIIIGGLVTTLGALSTVAAVIGIGLAPLIGIVAAIVFAIGAVVYLVWNYWDEIKAAFSSAGTWLG